MMAWVASLYLRELYMANIAPPITPGPKRPDSGDVWEGDA
jgi:hypothetical protein